MSNLPYRLGLPAWAFPGWQGSYFESQPSPLASYAEVFNCVEGNTTFYSTPDVATVDGWLQALDGKDFRFSFKLPQSVTHERRFNIADLDRFLTAIEPLKPCLGPFLVQFPAWAGAQHIDRFAPVFEILASVGECVIEVRHPTFFQDPTLLEPVLNQYRFGRVMLDSRALYQGDLSHPDIQKAIHEKPDVAVLETIYNDLAFVRLILHPDGVSNLRWMNEWVERTVTMMRQGYDVYMFIHCPNNQHCPPFALSFHRALQTAWRNAMNAGNAKSATATTDELPDLPAWPVPQQGSLL